MIENPKRACNWAGGGERVVQLAQINRRGLVKKGHGLPNYSRMRAVKPPSPFSGAVTAYL